MRKVVVLLVLALFVCSFVVYAQDSGSSIQDARKNVGNKAARGVKNAALGVTEIPKRIVDIYSETSNPFWAIVAGAYQGTIKAVVRTSSGLVDIVTCPVRPDEPPFIDPDFVFASAPKTAKKK